MPQWVWLIAALVAYVVLTRWLLPKLGVPTWRSAACAGSRRDSGKEFPSENSGTQPQNIPPATKTRDAWIVPFPARLPHLADVYSDFSRSRMGRAL